LNGHRVVVQGDLEGHRLQASTRPSPSQQIDFRRGRTGERGGGGSLEAVRFQVGVPVQGACRREFGGVPPELLCQALDHARVEAPAKPGKPSEQHPSLSCVAGGAEVPDRCDNIRFRLISA